MRRIPMICSSVNRFLFIVRLLERTQHYNEGISGEQVTSAIEPGDIPLRRKSLIAAPEDEARERAQFRAAR
jgi:hypothetical protein